MVWAVTCEFLPRAFIKEPIPFPCSYPQHLQINFSHFPLLLTIACTPLNICLSQLNSICSSIVCFKPSLSFASGVTRFISSFNLVMAIHNLEENPDLFIVPTYYENKFLYKVYNVSGENDPKHLHNIDLRTDKLMIYGTEIKESTLTRLQESLIWRRRNGSILVNCYGACYFWVGEKGWNAPVQNVIFDWSQFGVIVPNSMNDSFREKLEQKEKEIDEMKHQLSSTKADLDASKKEVEDLKEQLSACKRGRDDMEAKLQQACSQLSSNDVELESRKIELESSQKEVNELQGRLSACMKESQNMEVKLRKLCDELSSAKSELQSATTQLELSKGRVMQLEEQLSTNNRERQNMELELQKLQGQLSLLNSELQSTKTLLESSNRILKESEDHLAFYRKEVLDKQAELQKARDELSAVQIELYSTMSQLESSKERVRELEEQLSASKNESKEAGVELQKVQCQLSLVMQELQFTKSLLESSMKMLQELKDQLFTWRSEDLHGEAELQKASQYLWSEVKSTSQRLQDLLIELTHRCHSQSRIQCLSNADSPLEDTSPEHSLLLPEECNIQPSLLAAHELPISLSNKPMSIEIEEDIHVHFSNDMSANGASD